MLGNFEYDDNGVAQCPHCKAQMGLACYGEAWLCRVCDYVEIATDGDSPHYTEFLKEHKKHSSLCVCETCRGNLSMGDYVAKLCENAKLSGVYHHAKSTTN